MLDSVQMQQNNTFGTQQTQFLYSQVYYSGYHIYNKRHRRCFIWRRQWHPTPVLLSGESHGQRSLVGCSPWGREEWDTTEWLPFHFHALEKEMAAHSSVIAWRLPGTGEPGGLPSTGSHRVGHDWRDLAAAAAGEHKANLGIPAHFFLFKKFYSFNELVFLSFLIGG